MSRTERIFLVLAICAVARTAAASSILVSDGRQLSISDPGGLGCAVSDVIYLPAAPFAPFDESHTLSDPDLGALTASQDTVVEAERMGGSGTGSNTTGTSHFCARSTFSITFDLSASSAYQFAGTLVTGDDQAFGTLSLTSSAGDEFDHLVYGVDSQDFEESGVLLPGRYTLYAFVHSGAANESSWVFDLQLVPEPGRAALLALALASLPVSGRLLRRARSAWRTNARVSREQQQAERDG